MGYIAPTGWLLSCCCLLKESVQPISCHQATGRAFFVGTRSTFQVFTQDAGTALGQEAPWGGPLASSLRPPATRVNAYLVLCPPCGDFVGIRSYKQFSKKQKTTKKKIVALNGENVGGGGVRCQKSWCSFFSSLIYYCFLTESFHLTLPRGKGMPMQKGPIVFNCMHWRVAAQLKCFKCLCLKHRGSRSHRAHPDSNKLTPGCTTDRKKGGGGQGAGEWDNSPGLVGRTGFRHTDKDRSFRQDMHEDVVEQGHGCGQEQWRQRTDELISSLKQGSMRVPQNDTPP